MPRTPTKTRKKNKAKVNTRIYDTANYLRDEQDMVRYLECARIGRNVEVVSAARGDIVRARRMIKRNAK